MKAATTLRCSGCGAVAEAPYPFRCPRAREGDDVDHVLVRDLDARAIPREIGAEPNPFVRYRRHFHAYHTAIAGGMSDAAYVALVERLDERVRAVDGRGFRVTPLARSDALGGVWVKDETGNVGDSHKARHLFGLLVYLEIAAALGIAPREDPPLAIASCGNAALAAAIVARAACRTLRVFVPPDADPEIVARLDRLGAERVTCDRTPGMVGDPAVIAFRCAVAAGAIPFSCQGSDAGLTIDGGATLGLELANAGVPFDRVLVQVGGGALASAVIQGFCDALALGRIPALPRFHAVQTRAVAPLRRAYDRIAARLLARLGASAGSDRERADLLRKAPRALIDDELAFAARHRSSFMWPWENEPRSVARAILDDETYDWLAVVRGMLISGGWPLNPDEDTLTRANALAREATGIRVGPSGSSGLAGLMELTAADPSAARERVALIFSGARG
jgi:threonine synthase